MSSSPCKIVIPSHKRADRVITGKLLRSPIICVAESQRDEYVRHNPGAEIVCHPDDVVGLIPKRNWMVKHFGDIFMLDDDISKVFINYRSEDDLENSTVDPVFIEKIIYNLYDLAKMLGINLFGFSNLTAPVQYNEFDFLSLRRSITGCSYGMLKNDYLVWNEKMKVKEDMWISCLAKYYDRKVLVDLRYTFVQQKTMVNRGGLAGIRNQDTEDQSILELKKNFGSVIHMKSKGTVIKDGKVLEKKDKIKHNISVKFCF